MENRVSPQAVDRIQQCRPVHDVGYQRSSTELEQFVAFARSATEADHLVTVCDEGAHQGYA